MNGHLNKDMKKDFSSAISVFFLLFVNIQCLNAQNPNEVYGTGKIIDTVKCQSNPIYSYALYLPVNYSKNVKWPIIYVFDPGARGSLGLSCFMPAAEKYGYIAVCSNNSKNFLSGPELKVVVNNLFQDTELRFSIDPGRIYTSGFSGGSRVASMIALNNEKISGVIACGAGFPTYAGFSNIPSFDYFGLIGNRDMNYLELCDLEMQLDSLGVTSELRIFNGGHNWPSSDLIMEAVEWLDLKAMQNGGKNGNPEFVNSLFRKYEERAALLSAQGNMTESVRIYNYITKDFPDESTRIKLKAKIDSLRMTKDFIKSLKSRNKDWSWELEKQNSLLTDLDLRARSEQLPDSIRNWWTVKIKVLRSMEKGKDSSKQEIASRVLMLINVACYETGRNNFNLKRFRAASICYQLASIVDPENKNIHFMLARIYALNNETGESFRSLEKAIKLGYNNRQSIEKDTVFMKLKNEKKYREIINQIR